MQQISDVLPSLLAKGDLPEQVQFLIDYGPGRAGNVLAWRGDGFYTADGAFVFYPFFIRQNMGSIFAEYKAAQNEVAA